MDKAFNVNEIRPKTWNGLMYTASSLSCFSEGGFRKANERTQNEKMVMEIVKLERIRPGGQNNFLCCSMAFYMGFCCELTKHVAILGQKAQSPSESSG